MHEASNAIVLKQVLPDAESIELASDIQSCRAFLAILAPSVFDRFIEQGRASFLDADSEAHYIRFHTLLHSSRAHLNSQALVELFFELEEAWSDALSFDNWFVECAESGGLRFRKAHECPPGSQPEHAREAFLHAIECASHTMKTLLNHIHRQFPELATQPIQA